MPSFPLELERLIFETAVIHDWDHDNRVQIMLVAKRVYEWIRPIVYRVVFLTESLREGYTQSWRKAAEADIAPFVRHFIAYSYQNDILNLMNIFRNVENLAISDGHGVTSESLKKLNGLPLSKLSAEMSISLDEAIKNCDVFKNLTHLEILSLNESIQNECKALMELPKLSHLCFSFYVEDGVAVDLLKHCATLQVLISIAYKGRVVERTVELDDPRYLVLQDYQDLDFWMWEWLRSANGGFGFWEHAEVIIEARKRKHFVDKSSFIFSRKTWTNGLNDDGVRWYQERGYTN